MAPRQASFFPGPSDAATAGLDEAGRGCLAGPVVAAAVILAAPLEGLADSKQLTASRREFLAAQIKARALAWAVGIVSARVIDRINILNASLLAMARAVRRLVPCPLCLLLDGNKVIPHAILASHWAWQEPLPQQQAIVHGDALVPSISAASIIAKTTRDAIMRRVARRWDAYGFERHKGYGTREHLDALRRLAPCPIHRLTFRGVRQEELRLV